MAFWFACCFLFGGVVLCGGLVVCLVIIITCLVLCGLGSGLVASSNIRVLRFAGFVL